MEKYWAGETTLAEEKALRTYLRELPTDKLSPEMSAYFEYLDYSKRTTHPVTTDQLVESVATAAPKPIRVASRTHSLRPLAYRWGAAAAVVLVLLIAAWALYSPVPKASDNLQAYWETKATKDPQLAFEQTRAALLVVSQRLKLGEELATEQLQKVRQFPRLRIQHTQ